MNGSKVLTKIMDMLRRPMKYMVGEMMIYYKESSFTGRAQVSDMALKTDQNSGVYDKLS